MSICHRQLIIRVSDNLNCLPDSALYLYPKMTLLRLWLTTKKLFNIFFQPKERIVLSSLLIESLLRKIMEKRCIKFAYILLKIFGTGEGKCIYIYNTAHLRKMHIIYQDSVLSSDQLTCIISWLNNYLKNLIKIELYLVVSVK